MYDVKPIRTYDDYKEALRAIEKLWDAQMNTLEGDKLEILVTLVEKYEEKNFPINPPDPIEAIKFVMEQQSINRSDLDEIFGSKSRTSEILNKQRKLNLRMIRGLYHTFNIPYEILTEDYQLE